MFSRHAIQELATQLRSLPGVQLVGTYGKPETKYGETTVPKILLLSHLEYVKRFTSFLKENHDKASTVGKATASRIAAAYAFAGTYPCFLCIVADFDTRWMNNFGDKLEVLVFPINWYQYMAETRSLYSELIDDLLWEEILETAHPVIPE
jgi:hypothetical protein